MNSLLRSLTASWPWTTVDVLTHLWQSTVVGVVVLAVLLVGRGLSARTRRMLGWMALIKFVLPAGFFVQMFARIGATPVRWVESGALAGPITLPGLIVAAPAADAPAPVSIGLVVTLVWLAGFLGLVVSWLVRGRSLRRQLLAEIQPVSREVEQRIMAAADRVGLRETPRCFAVDGERAPGVLGFLAPMVVLPRGLEATLARAEFDSVLIHELVHVQRRDNLWSAVQALCVSLFWFHPIVWLLNRRLALETEQSCDERVLEITGDPDTYASGIVKAVQHALGVAQPGLIGATTPPVIQRIKNIFSDHSRRDRPLMRGAALAGGALLLALSGYTGSFAVPARAATPAAAAPTTAAEAVAAPAAAAAPTPIPVAVPAEPTISVDFPDEQIRQIIHNVAALFQLNVVMPDTLKGKTTVKLKDVTWRQIFQIVLAPVGYTFVEEGGIVKIVPAPGLGANAVPAATPVALASLPAKAAEARLITQADRLNAEAEALQREVDAANAAREKNPEAPVDPEAATKAASLAAIDARRHALDAAVAATADSAQLAALAEKREADARELRALSAQDRAKRPDMISLDAIDTRLKAPEGVRATPKAPAGPVAETALIHVARSEAEAFRASGIKVFEPNQLDRQPVPTFQARPQYPFALRRAGTAGEATIDFVVNDQGDVKGAYATTFTHAEFGEAAAAAVVKWKFKPGRKGGAAVNTHMQVPIVFTLNEK